MLPRKLVLLGNPVTHSLSPLFQNAALRRAGIDAKYEAVEVTAAELPHAVETLRHQYAAGNVTIPHKNAMLSLCETVTDDAKRANAVNTFWFVDGVLHGDNTDVGGFDAAVCHLVGVIHEGARVTLIGAGGAAGAVAAATSEWPGAKLTVWNRTVTTARAFARRFDHVCIETDLTRAVADADLVVNATSVGLRDGAHPVEVDLLPPHAAVVDLVYTPGETAWVRAARASGHLAEDGLVMLVEQGALAFKRWFGVEPDRTVMWGAITDHLTPTARSLGRGRRATAR